MKDGNACLGLFIGATLAIPVYGAAAWVVSRLFRIDYGMALVIVLVVGTVAGGLVALVAMRRAPENNEAPESLTAKKSDSRASR